MRNSSRRSRRSATVSAFVPLVLMLCVTACSTPVGVRRLGGDRVFREVSATALSRANAISEFSTQVLSRYDLVEQFYDDPEDVLTELHQSAEQEWDRNVYFALAELSYLHGRAEDSNTYYLASVTYAYLYLFGHRSEGARDPYDPRFRIAADLYNRALSEFLKTRKRGDAVLEAGVFELPFGELEVTLELAGFPWSLEEFHRFVPAADFQVRGLRTRYRNRGLGAPLIALRKRPEDPGKTKDYLPLEAKIAATAFLRLPLEDANLMRHRIKASLELYAPFIVSDVEVEGQEVPLEADLTAPLAYALEESRIWDFELGAFLSSDEANMNTGIFMLQPYSRGKIPVVFVHGTASSPARWAEMFNELQGYPELRERYQFWFFVYATGNPIAYSASLLRDALRDILAAVDPDHSDPALQRMVLIGHSQGGLLTKMQTIDSDDRFLNDASGERIEGLDQPEMEIVRKALIFDRVTAIKRVIFLSTPHRGSFVAGNWLGSLASSMVSLPGNLLKAGRDLIAQNETLKLRGLKIPTSVENMSPNNAFIKTLASIPVPPEVSAHSVVAVKGDGAITEGNDGVVEYSSAHIDEAISELVVFTGHSCQGHPATILEVRRILLEHSNIKPVPTLGATE